MSKSNVILLNLNFNLNTAQVKKFLMEKNDNKRNEKFEMIQIQWVQISEFGCLNSQLWLFPYYYHLKRKWSKIILETFTCKISNKKVTSVYISYIAFFFLFFHFFLPFCVCIYIHLNPIATALILKGFSSYQLRKP